MSYRIWCSRLALVAIVAAVSAGSVTPAEAQFGNRLKERLKRNAEDKAIEKAVEKENEAIDGATAGKPPEDTARTTAAPTEPGSTAAATPAVGDSAGAGAPAGASTAAADRKVWANYDFVPGQRTIFFTDFTEDQVGNFPERLEFKTGAMEVVEFEGGRRALRASDRSELIIPLPEVLPDKYTIELDVISRTGQGVAASTLELAGGREMNSEHSEVAWGNGWFSLRGGPVKVDLETKDRERYLGKPASFRILGDGKYLKAYADERRVANIPNADFQRAKALVLRLQGADDAQDAVYLTRIRVAESEKTIYDALSSTGRWATQGILFDTGKSDVKPESTPTLKQIAATLKEHPELKVEIQGHTDNVGQAAANLKLSQARADAVKATLTKEYGVGEGQLTAKGYGDTKPSADNKTAEGRANNRRVELLKS
jgi:outer membrane protein OmpA-like peptidoglycan-associated protein